MTEKEIKQFKPAHADHVSGYDWTNKRGKNAFDDMFANERVVVQPKHDGERIKMHIDGDNTFMDSRRISKKTGLYAQCQQNFPEFQKLGLKLGYTVLDGELKATRDGKDNWSDVVGVIHSLPERAEALKATKEFEIKYVVFDICYYNNEDVTSLPYHERLKLAKEVVDQIANPQIEMVETIDVKTKEEAYALRDKFIAEGKEGVVIKSLDRKYFDVGAYIKAKRFETKDVVVYGFEYGNGKYANTVGALKCGYWDPVNDTVVHVCDVNCGTDKDRDEWLQGMTDGSSVNAVIEVKCQEVTDSSLRHPVYVRRRPDKDCKMCTKDSIFN